MTATKSEPATPTARPLKRKKVAYAESSSDDDAPLASSPAKSVAVPMPGAIKATTIPASAVNGSSKIKGNASKKEIGNNDDNDAPKKKREPNGKAQRKAKVPPKKKLKEDIDDLPLSEDDDKPLVQKATTKGKRKLKVETDPDVQSSEDDKPLTKRSGSKNISKKSMKGEDPSGSDAPKPKKKTGKANKEEVNGSPKKGKGKKKDDDDEAEEVFRWWETQDPDGDGSIKWQTLEHSGVIFPPPYEPLPPDVKMKYNGRSS